MRGVWPRPRRRRRSHARRTVRPRLLLGVSATKCRGQPQCPVCSEPYARLKRTSPEYSDGAAPGGRRARQRTETVTVSCGVLPVSAGRMTGSGKVQEMRPTDTALVPPVLTAWAQQAKQGQHSQVYIALGLPSSDPHRAPTLVEQCFRPARSDADSSTDVPTTPESPEVRDFMGLLGATFRQFILVPDAQLPSMPVRDYPGFLDRALHDPSAMHRFFHALGVAEPTNGTPMTSVACGARLPRSSP